MISDEEFKRRKTILQKGVKIVKVLLPVSFAPLVIIVIGIAAGGISGRKNIIPFFIQGLMNPAFTL